MTTEVTKSEIEEAELVSVQPYEQNDRALFDVQIATAKRYPRNIKRATENALSIVTLDEETAKSCHYSVPRGGKAITGPSVHLAKIIMQQWGNLRAEARVIAVDNKQVTSEAVCFDLETNIAVKVQVKRSIMTNKGRMNDDMITVTGNAANSIALRNAIYNVIPRGIVDKVYNAAKDVITGDVSNEQKMNAKRLQLVSELKDTYGLTDAEVLFPVGKSAISQLTKADLLTLYGIHTAIKDGDTNVDTAFRGKSDKTTPVIEVDHELERAVELFKTCKTVAELDEVFFQMEGPDLREDIRTKYAEIKATLPKK